MSLYKKIGKNIAHWYADFQDRCDSTQFRVATLSLVIGAMLIGGYSIHHMYVAKRERKAFEALMEVMSSYEQTLSKVMGFDPNKDQEKIQQGYQDCVLLLDALMEENKSSNLTPYFLVLKSQIVLHKDQNLAEAMNLLDQAISLTSTKTELGSLFYLKRIKMGLDSSDVAEVARCLQELKQLATNKHSFVYQEAQYVLGLYYLSQGNIKQGQDLFKDIINAADCNDLVKNPWVKMAQEKLGLDV